MGVREEKSNRAHVLNGAIPPDAFDRNIAPPNGEGVESFRHAKKGLGRPGIHVGSMKELPGVRNCGFRGAGQSVPPAQSAGRKAGRRNGGGKNRLQLIGVERSLAVALTKR